MKTRLFKKLESILIQYGLPENNIYSVVHEIIDVLLDVHLELEKEIKKASGKKITIYKLGKIWESVLNR